MVALGTFIINALFFSLPFCFGIMFSEFLEERGASSTTTAAIYNLFLVLWNASIVLVNPLCQEFGTRAVGAAAVVGAALAVVVSGFAPSVYFLYFSFSVVAGVSTGVSVGISYAVLPPYFDKNGGKANTFLVAGSPVTQMVLAPILRYLLDCYGLQGAALLHGAIMLHGLVAVSFFHPVKWHLKPRQSQGAPQPHQHATLLPHATPSPPPADSAAPGSGSGETAGVARNRSLQRLRSGASPSGSLASVVSGGSAEVPAGLVFLSREAQGEEKEAPSGQKGGVVGVLLAVSRTGTRVVERLRRDVAVLREWRCVILAVTLTLSQTTLLNFVMMLPFVARAARFTLEDTARCLALMGVVNLVTRLVVSPLADCPFFSIRVSVILGYLLRASGIAVAAVLSGGWWQQLVWCGVVYGVGLGFSLSMFNLSIVHYMGVECLRPALGIIGLVGAVGFPILGPLIGLVRDLTTSYTCSLGVMVTLDVVSAALWLLMPAAQARDAASRNKDVQLT